MKTLYSDTIAEIINYDVVGGGVSKPIIKTEYYSDTLNTYAAFTDLENRTINLSNENKRYQVYSFMPPSKKIDFTVNNFAQIYSTGSGNSKASILKKNLKVRAWSGFELTQIEATQSETISDLSNTKLVHTQSQGLYIVYDTGAYTGTVDSGLISNLYGSGTYGDTYYDYSGYYQRTFTLSDDEYKFKQVTVTTNSNKFDFKYRVSPFSDFSGAPWSTSSSCSTGANIKTFDCDLADNYLQIGILFKPDVLSTVDQVQSITFTKEDNVFLFPQGEFLLDDPKYQDTKVRCSGRDYIKKALETEINMPDMSSGVNIATAMTYVFDRCNIPYDTADWDSTSTTVTVNSTFAEELTDISGWKVADYLMDAINAGNDDWRLKTEENGNLSLKNIPTDIEADYSLHYFYNIENINKSFDSDKQLQRITIMNKDIVADVESCLGSYTGTATSWHLTYGTSALYVRYTDANNVITSETARGNTGITFALSGSPADINVYGCFPKNAITDEVYAEAGNSANIISNNGSTYKRVNPFFNQTMCDSFSDYMIGLYADPAYKIDLTMVPNPYLELNDNVMVFDLYTYTDDIYGITEISESWNDPELKHRLTLENRGFDLGRFIWDRHGVNTGINDLNYDLGFVWDQDLEIGSSDSNTYRKQIYLA